MSSCGGLLTRPVCAGIVGRSPSWTAADALVGLLGLNEAHFVTEERVQGDPRRPGGLHHDCPRHTNLPHYLGGTRSDISRTIPCSFPLNFSRNSGLAIRASRSSAPSGAMLLNSCRMACRRSGGC